MRPAPNSVVWQLTETKGNIMTKPQREALARVNAAVPMATMEEYEAMSPHNREKVRKGFSEGFDADGVPQIKLEAVRVKYRIAAYLSVNGLATVTYTHRRDYAYMIPK